ncbi:MAG: M42 family metallopeptidase [Oscillospiraceae bacterium]|jgi:putative aminopeptidase FrvX|nr:M42 family metallopeptidase [Oscillospiraceae bacterium]
MNLEGKLRLLCEAVGVSGDEGAACRRAAEMLREYTDDVRVDGNLSVLANVYDAGEDKPKLLLDAHIDEIGMIVTHIEDGGFVKVSGLGTDARLMLAQEVVLHGEKDIPGVILAKAPHLTKPEERKKVPETKELWIDTGYQKEELEKILMPGDRVTMKGGFTKLQGDFVSSKALDDRSCVACILAALEELKGEELPVSLTVAFSSQEEVGCRGAVTAAYQANADMAIALDVGFGMSPGVEKRDCGELGKGPQIGFAPALDRHISKKLVELAKAENIPFQYDVMGSGTGTNADGISVSRGGVRTGLISLPLRYMHMPIEVVRLCDIEAVGRLLAAFIRQADQVGRDF